MTPSEFNAFAQTRHGEHWIQPMADETDYSYAQLYGIVHRGRPVGKRLAQDRQRTPRQAEEAELSQLT